MKNLKKISVVTAILCLIVCALAGCGGLGGSKTEEETIEYEAILTSGHYTVGIDFPAGTYDISAVEGQGNVSSSNMFTGGLNVVIGTEASDLAVTFFKNAKLTDKVVLSVSGVKIKIESKNASAKELGKRVADSEKAIELTVGNYTVGTDITAGVYNVVWVSGSGVVSSDNMFQGGINALMGNSPIDTLYYDKEFKNVDLTKEGTTLKVQMTLKIKLIPVTVE